MILSLEKITKVIVRDTHLYEMNLELQSGLTVLLGRTLAGKTSLMRIMAGLDKPTTGRVLADGQDVTHLPVQKRRVAMVYQQFINYPSLSVYQNIASPLKISGVNKKEIDRRVRSVAEMVHLEEYLERLPGELSGGQQQRTAMARALVKDSDLLLFDEPLVNLDYKLREELRIEMREIFKQRKAIVIYATTEPMEALLLGGHVAVLDQGRLLQTGATVAVYHNPASVRVGEVFSDPAINIIDGIVEGSRATLGKDVIVPLTGHLSELTPGRYRFGARANHLAMARASTDDIEFNAVVEMAEVNGSETFIHVGHQGISWVIQEQGVHSFGLDKALSVFLEPRYLYVFSQDGYLVATPPHGATASNSAH